MYGGDPSSTPVPVRSTRPSSNFASPKSVTRSRRSVAAGLDHLQGDHSPEALVPGAVDDPNATLARILQHRVRLDPGPRCALGEYPEGAAIRSSRPLALRNARSGVARCGRADRPRRRGRGTRRSPPKSESGPATSDLGETVARSGRLPDPPSVLPAPSRPRALRAVPVLTHPGLHLLRCNPADIRVISCGRTDYFLCLSFTGSGFSQTSVIAHHGPRSEEAKPGTSVTREIIAQGDRLTVLVNGRVVVNSFARRTAGGSVR
jgi:hypothetical protein